MTENPSRDTATARRRFLRERLVDKGFYDALEGKYAVD